MAGAFVEGPARAGFDRVWTHGVRRPGCCGRHSSNYSNAYRQHHFLENHQRARRQLAQQPVPKVRKDRLLTRAAQ